MIGNMGQEKNVPIQAALDLETQFYENISISKLSSLVAVNLTNAFDAVNHKNLLKKLDYYGFVV